MPGYDAQDPLCVLLGGILDYAGLFPPAGLPLAKVLENFANYQGSREQWILARVVVPAQQLPELRRLLPAIRFPEPWGISALVPARSPDPAAQDAAFALIHEHNAAADRGAPVEVIECRADTPAMLADSLAGVPDGLSVFWEIPVRGVTEPMIGALADLKSVGQGVPGPGSRGGHFAKIRTGGVEAAMIPAPEEVARFIHLCAERSVAFKATAGLHHPVRSMQPLTYAPEAPQAVLHGFLNVFLAAAAAWTRSATVGQIEDILLAAHPESFLLKNEVLGVIGNEFTAEELRRTRAQFAVSFGSCSFVEPVDDLQNMEWL